MTEAPPVEPQTPSWLKALGKELPPETVELRGKTYRLERVFKHDFFAFTARYSGPGNGAVLKIGRKASFFGLPLGWIGRWHARRESLAFERLEDLDTVPGFLGRYGKHGLSHEFIPGHELGKGERVPDDFFDRLRTGLAEIHRRGMAYVDLEKCENVLVGTDGRPYLFDFQIAWQYTGGIWPLAWARRRFQQADCYHVTKLQRRTRPDQLSEEELAASRKRPPYVRIYSTLTRPLTRMRRWILTKVDPQKKRGERGSVHRTSDQEA